MKALTIGLEMKKETELRNLAERYKIPRFETLNKKELVNELELHFRSEEFKNEMRNTLTMPMMNYLDILLADDEYTMKFKKLMQKFEDRVDAPSFITAHNELLKMGLIYADENDEDKRVVFVPKELAPWLIEHLREKIETPPEL